MPQVPRAAVCKWKSRCGSDTGASVELTVRFLPPGSPSSAQGYSSASNCLTVA